MQLDRGKDIGQHEALLHALASGYADDPVMAAPKDHGFAGSICKPFSRSDLAEMLRKSREE